MHGFKEFLVEKTYSINHEVDWIYNELYKDFIDTAKKTGKYKRLPDKVIDGSDFHKIAKSSVVKQAIENNPISTITFGVDNENTYKPKSYGAVLTFSISSQVLDLHNEADDINDFDVYASGSWLKNELTEARLKGTIDHELSHWISDSINNRHIKNMLTTANTAGRKGQRDGKYLANFNKSANKGKERNHLFLTDFELNAQIQAIVQYKRITPKRVYDSKTFDELLKVLPFFLAIKSEVSKSEMVEWRKYILKRMARENLLGKTMKGTMR